MAGYSPDFSMSNNAKSAYAEGRVPASKIPGVPAVLVRQILRCRRMAPYLEGVQPDRVLRPSRGARDLRADRE